MTNEDLINHAVALRKRIRGYAAKQSSDAPPRAEGARAQVCEFLRDYGGINSSFLRAATNASGFDSYLVAQLEAVLDGFIEYVQAGLHSKISPARQAQIDVVSDMLDQAQGLLESQACHPAAAAVLIGASLEEFLRNWIEAEKIEITSNPGLAAYCAALRTADLITKQDHKDITAWAGMRNHAAHGEWEHVEDRSRVRLMLEGVNLFLRQKSQ